MANVRSAAVDWVTVTAKGHRDTSALASVGRANVRREAEAGNDLKQWKWQGYEGESAGQCAIGSRADGIICRLSGAVAAHNWRVALMAAVNVTRLDLAVTVDLQGERGELARQGWIESENAKPERGHPRTASLVLNRPAGETLYLGSRASEIFCRLYDKGAESGDPDLAGCWRYEVEYKGDYAKRVGKRILNVARVESFILTRVHERFGECGVTPRFQPGGAYTLEPPTRQTTDDERRLEWLRKQVKPAVRGLVENGLGFQVLGAIGLLGWKLLVDEDLLTGDAAGA